VSVEAISWALNLVPVPADRGGQPSSACKFVLVGLPTMPAGRHRSIPVGRHTHPLHRPGEVQQLHPHGERGATSTPTGATGAATGCSDCTRTAQATIHGTVRRPARAQGTGHGHHSRRRRAGRRVLRRPRGRLAADRYPPGQARPSHAGRARRGLAVRKGSLLPCGLDLNGVGLVSGKRHDQGKAGQYKKPHGYQGLAREEAPITPALARSAV